ncbi:RNA polymerase sigma factor [Pontiella agarivorans]|uniref:Sigma-70 family RNA polymerase sigma factor n=1 Tax=Pontiella agarivorans TaxID=3038953 RepID=A0ABU5MS42_9BACT|nr:sigma-70 family RNA polymerase sigma factor [Pontiella agarivorans]MDZ8117020.1 sigma-70 family RNA polymerase sigma factor [Pontiella agarivorans]
MDNTWKTRYTLLEGALKRDDEEAWTEFTAVYRPFIIYLLNRIRIPSADFEDMTQEVLITLWKRLDCYKKDKGKFRTWLRTVVRNEASDYFSRRKKVNSAQEIILNHEAQQVSELCSETELNQMIDEEWKAHLSMLALKRIEDAFGKKTIQCFLEGMDGVSAADTAKRLNIAVETVYSSRKRVKARILREIQHLRKQYEF